MTTFSDPDSEITGSEDIIRVSDLKARIRNVKPWHVEDTRIPESQVINDLGSFATQRGAVSFIGDRAHLVPVEYADESDELEALQALLSDLGYLGDYSFLVHDEYLAQYAENDSELPYDSPLSPYVDWERVAHDNYRVNMTMVVFRGSEYWVAPR